MKKNIDDTGRLWRLVIAFALLFFSWWMPSFLLLALALFVFFEACVGWCAVYQLLGKNSCSRE